MLHGLMKRIEKAERLDAVAEPLSSGVQKAVTPAAVRNLLSGTWLGHSVHPMLTDVPIGLWTASTVLDLLGGEDAEPASDLLVAVGLASAVPTAVTGMNDWSDTSGGEKRLGVAHALANTLGVALFAVSLVARRNGNRGAGKTLGLLGYTSLLAGGYIGGHLSYGKGVNVNRTAFEASPEGWTPALDEDELADGRAKLARVGDVDVMVYREGGRVFALANTCTHMGGSLVEGDIHDRCVTCPLHGSTFRLEDGSVVRGPAAVPQPVFEARVLGGRVELRAAR